MNDLNYKGYLKWLSGLFTVGALAVIAVNWLIDPLQFYRRAAYPPFLIQEKRFQAPGLARNYDYDTVIIGTSISENFEAKDLEEKLGLNSLNLSMQGASAREQHLTLEVALRTGKVRNVIWDLNYEYLRGDPNWVANYDGSFPFHLYDENPFNDINNYLLSVDTTKSSLKVLLGRLGLNTYRSATPDEMFAWHKRRSFSRESVRSGWQRAVRKRQTIFLDQAGQYALTNLNANFDLHVLAAIRQHPEVKFQLYFPPYSIGYHANLWETSPEIFENMLRNKLHILEQTRGLPNAQLFDFQTADDIVFNPDNYCDLMHFSHSINGYILESFGAGRHRAGGTNIGELKSLVTGPRAAEWVKQYAR